HTFAELYRERSALAAALAKRVLMEELKTGVPRGTFAGIRHDDQPGIDGYRTVLYIELPTGQVSWHFNDAGATDFLDGIPRYLGTYDGHTTPEKCRRIETLPVPY
ncbi:MAG TPA: hypothetical protein VFE70_03340, partial [Candidatus Elarobacter sp.]|nr:hypothetical protein [Candidatus Elarobacter sp.]